MNARTGVHALIFRFDKPGAAILCTGCGFHYMKEHEVAALKVKCLDYGYTSQGVIPLQCFYQINIQQ